ncbi:MAG TPA: tetratricopeptide repeat protein [Vicinamibacteria bacterium]|nr:tetratricopeptide repeat protein [Vicinamibacteria bacterium]
MARSKSQWPRPAPTPAANSAGADPNQGGPSGNARTLGALLAATVVAKAVVLAQLHRHPLLQPAGGLDSAAYVDLARRVASGDWALGPEPYFVAPLYVYFLGAIFGATGGSLLAAKLVQVLLGTGAVGLTYLTARRWLEPRAALVAGAALALTGVVTFNEVVLLQSALDPFLTALSLFLLTRALQTPKALGFLGCGMAIGLHALNRPNVLLWAGVLPLLLALRRPRLRSLVQALAVAAGVALAIAPASLRNRAVAGEWILISSHGGLNLHIGNHAGADGTYRSVAGITPNVAGQAQDTRRVAESALGRQLSTGEVSAYFSGLALDWLHTHPMDALRLWLRKLAYLLNQTDLALNHSYAYYSRDEPGLLRFLIVGPWLLVPFGLVGLADRCRNQAGDGFRLTAAFAPVYAVSVVAFFVSSRYRLPLLLPLCLGTGHAASRLLHAWSTRQVRRLAALGAGLLPLAVLAAWPFGLDDGRSEEATLLVLHLVDNGQLDEAQDRLARLEAHHPARGRLWYRVGSAYQVRGDAAEAVRLFERAHRAEPDRPEIRLGLGQVLLDLGRPAEAVPHLRASRTAGWRPALAEFELARALLEAGDDQGAAAVVDTARIPPETGARGWQAWGELALGAGRPQLAAAWLGESLTRSPEVAAAREKLGLALAMLGRDDEAEIALVEALRLDPGSASAHLNLAVLRARQGRRAEARSLAREALRLRPDYLEARGLLRELGE